MHNRSRSICCWAAGLLQAAFWLGAACIAPADEPKTPSAQPVPPLTLRERKFTPAEQAQLDEAKRLDARALELLRAEKFGEAIPFAEQALAIRKQVLGVKHPDYATSLNDVASLYLDLANYAKAEPLYVEALAIRKQVLGVNDLDYARSLNNLAVLYRDQGNYVKAEPLYAEALAIKKQLLGEEHPDYAASLNNLAGLYEDQGNHVKAEPLYVEALAIRKQVLGAKDPSYAGSLNNLAVFYAVQGNYAKAEPLFVEVLAINKQVFGEKHPLYAGSLNNLAESYENQGNYAKAEPLFVEALAINKQVFGNKHPCYAVDLRYLAELYRSQGNYTKAEPLFVEALAIYKQVFGEKHPSYAESLDDLAVLYTCQGKYAKAEPLFVEALAIRNQVLGAKHPNFAKSLSSLARCEVGLRSTLAAAGHAQQATEIMRQHLEQTAAIQSEHQQLLMIDDVRYIFSNFLSAGRAAQVAPETVYDEVLAWKGAVTSRQALLRALRRDLAKKPQAAALYDELEAATSELAVSTNRVPNGPERESYQKRLDALSEHVEDLQAKLAKVSGQFAEQRAQQKRTSAELREALPADTALVDLIEYDHFGWTDKNKDKPIQQRHVAAFVVRRDQPMAWIDLGRSDHIASAVEKWRASYGFGEESQKAAATLRQKVWQPLEADVAGATTILISPDGELAKFPWIALPGKTPGKYLIEERAIAVIPVPQALPELLASRGLAPVVESAGSGEPNQTGQKVPVPLAPPSLLLVGDVDYGGDPGLLLASNQGQRAVRDGAMKWNELPGTRAEILAIRDSFEQKFPDGTDKQLRKQQATAEAVREAAPKYRYLHFATHGFFADPKIRSILAPSDKPESGIDRGKMLERATGEHPGLLSGIVLTGANQPPVEGKGDGILTALEVGELDLGGVELATLSACETGLGKTAGGEGVLGLQRAFQTAGARTTVTSLWKIPDDATRSLMIDFYENLWTKKMSKIEALRQAQLTLMREGVKRGMELEADQPADAEHRLPPYYWAAFVLSGDWR